MIQKLLATMLVLALGLVVSGGTDSVQAQNSKVIKLAMLAPRGSVVHREFMKVDQEVQNATNKEWSVKVYPSGAAGDDIDVIRKMKVGQMDGGVITTTGLSQIVRQVAVLDTPGVIGGYKQLEAVQKALKSEWDKMFLDAGVKLVAWWEAGRYRLFSKGPARNLAELRTHRAWLWPDSQVLKELWRTAGVTGVPLGVPDVFGALQTGMVDAVINTPVALVALRWHLKLDHVSKREAGVLLLSWVMNKSIWEAMPAAAREKIEKQTLESAERYKTEARKEDAKAFETLLQRGYIADDQSPKDKKEWDDVEAQVRKRLTGRVFPEALLQRVLAAADTAK